MRFCVLLYCFIGFSAFGQTKLPQLQELQDSLPNHYLLNQLLFVEKTEVSNAQWWEYYKSIKTSDPENQKASLPDNTVWRKLLHTPNPKLEKYFGRKSFLNYPVVGISYEQAIAYCKWRSVMKTRAFAQATKGTKWEHSQVQFTFRLPTEEEWLAMAKQSLKGRRVERLQSQINCRKGTSSSRVQQRISQPVTNNIIGSEGVANLFGNVSEMTVQKGLAKGGNWAKPIAACTPKKANLYSNPQAWLGMRCVVDVSIIPKPKFENSVLHHAVSHQQRFDSLPLLDTTYYQPDPLLPVITFNYEDDALNTTVLSNALIDQRVTTITMAFTRYPYHLSDWRINYYELMAKRIQKLFKELPKLNASSIKWKIIRQTDCQTKAEAQKLFHGFIFELAPKEDDITMEDKKVGYDKETIEAYSLALDTFPQYKPFESVMHDYLKEHSEHLNGALVVMDWTASMYPYSCELILQNLKFNQHYKIRYFSFFNDGDDKKRHEKRIGNTGGIYFAPSDEMSWVLQTMNTAKTNGRGGDTPENDAEAIIKSIENYPDATNTILVADNKSPIRDSLLLSEIVKPIEVILCGIRYDFYGKEIHILNPQYYKLAQMTQGALYFEDYDRFKDRLETTLPTIKIDNHIFWVLDEDFKMDGRESINFVFRRNSISLAEIQKAKPKEINHFFEFNEENYPKLIELNSILNRQKSKALKKKKVKVSKPMKS